MGLARTGPLKPHAHSIRVCGALGRFDHRRLTRLAELTGSGLREVHRDRRSALWLDREPIRWQGAHERGLAWAEWPDDPRTVPSETEPTRSPDACGLLIRGRRRIVHSSSSGLAPVYWMDEDGATYFSSRIDPLVQTSLRRLRPDWSAWAAILRLGYAVGARTPFEDVRRLEHASTLERGPTGGIATVGRWTWAEEPLLPFEEALERLVEALRGAAEALDGRDLVLGLSGGGDSRIVLASLVGNGARPNLRALTLPGNWGRDEDERLARRAAAAAAVPHTVLELELDGYWRDADRVARATDYQQALEWAWLAPLAKRTEAESEALMLDGLAGDILVRGKFEPPEPTADGKDLLWRRLQAGRNPKRFLRRKLTRAVDDLARSQLMAVREGLDGHDAVDTLTVYRTRTTRGMAAGLATLGEVAPTVAPFTADTVARAALSCPPPARLGRRLQRETLARLAPALAEIPVTVDDPTAARPVPQRRLSESTLAGFQDLLRESPFRPWFRKALDHAVDAPTPAALGELRPSRVVNGLALHALWVRRYGDRLRAASPRRLLG
jgi:hypothetical protein